MHTSQVKTAGWQYTPMRISSYINVTEWAVSSSHLAGHFQDESSEASKFRTSTGNCAHYCGMAYKAAQQLDHLLQTFTAQTLSTAGMWLVNEFNVIHVHVCRHCVPLRWINIIFTNIRQGRPVLLTSKSSSEQTDAHLAASFPRQIRLLAQKWWNHSGF